MEGDAEGEKMQEENERKIGLEGHAEHAEEAKKWRRVGSEPEAWTCGGGYGLGRLGMEWTLYFVTRSNMRKIGEIEYPEEVPPFCWAREIISVIQGKRACVGWSERMVKGKPGTEDNSVMVPDILRKKGSPNAG